MLPVNEVFATIQGEATYTGTPAVFVRLQGCDVGCPWCDTKHTWALNPDHETTVADVLGKDGVEDKATWAQASEVQIITAIRQFPHRHVVITGGEPCQYDLAPLAALVRRMGRTMQVETSGTSPVRADDAWVTLSPKIGMPGGLKVREDAVARADEIKMPVGRPEDVARLREFLAAHTVHAATPVWLQPLSRSPKATTLCIEAAAEHGWRISVQTHAYIGVR